MNLDDINIQFHGISHSPAYSDYLKQKISQFYKGPASTCHIILTKKDFKLQGAVTLVTKGKKSLAILHGNNLDEVVNKLFKQIRRNLKRIKPPKFHQGTRREFS